MLRDVKQRILVDVKTRAAHVGGSLLAMLNVRSAAPSGRRSPRRLSSTALVGCGIVLLLFTLCSYAWMSVEQHKLESRWAASEAMPADAPDSHNAVTLLNIPKIDLQAAILDGTDRKSLLLAPGHLEETVWPGDAGNAVVAAHRDTFFRRLHELRKGDEVLVRRGGRQFRYAVSNTMIVNPNEVSVLRPSSDTRLTLVTCYPTYYIGPAPKRLVVVATLQRDTMDAAGKLQPGKTHQ
jgi:sortase A